jgi:hypothetical protein
MDAHGGATPRARDIGDIAVGEASRGRIAWVQLDSRLRSMAGEPQ